MKKLLLLPVLLAATWLATPPAQARLLPGTTAWCENGVQVTVHFGWFGSISSIDFTAC